ncbi:MAG: DHH family phosphoesterase [Nanoarchaeota archaeon]
MIKEEELNEIKSYLEKAENPLVFFDDDHDGLTSYILLKKSYEKIHGVVVKGGMKEEEIYNRKIEEYRPDFIFVLDRAEISQELIDSVNVPLILIDHHPVIERKGIKYFNPRKNDENDTRPVSYWCYQLVKNNLWIALVGIIGDYCYPKELIENFEYKELLNGHEKIEDILYDSELGMLVRLFNFILKGTTTQVRKNIIMLLSVKDPYEILQKKTAKGKFLFNYFEKIEKEYQKLVDKAKRNVTEDKVLLFTYPDNKLSLSASVSDKLKYLYPDKLVIVAREKEDYMAVSLRSNDIVLPQLLKKSFEGLDGYGGGHDKAAGASINRLDFMKFINNIRKNVKEQERLLLQKS